jgi:hypothetical protein
MQHLLYTWISGLQQVLIVIYMHNNFGLCGATTTVSDQLLLKLNSRGWYMYFISYFRQPGICKVIITDERSRRSLEEKHTWHGWSWIVRGIYGNTRSNTVSTYSCTASCCGVEITANALQIKMLPLHLTVNSELYGWHLEVLDAFFLVYIFRS